MREDPLWPFICISEEYVKLWTDMNRSSEHGLSLTALLGAVIDHEIGHWAFTLECNEAIDNDNDDDKEEALEGLLVSADLERTKNTPLAKKLWAGWKPDSGEAGEYVEYRSRGGILAYNKDAEKVYVRVGERNEDVHCLSSSYLKIYLGKTTGSSLRFTPQAPSQAQAPTQASGPSAKMKTRSHTNFFPHTTDHGCARPSSFQFPTGQHGFCERRVRTAIIARKILERRGFKTK